MLVTVSGKETDVMAVLPTKAAFSTPATAYWVPSMVTVCGISIAVAAAGILVMVTLPTALVPSGVVTGLASFTLTSTDAVPAVAVWVLSSLATVLVMVEVQPSCVHFATATPVVVVVGAVVMV